MIVEVQSKQTFGMWRWVQQSSTNQWELIAPTEMPGYSEEQFQQTFTDPDAFSDWLNSKLGIHISDADRLMSLAQEFSQGLMMREGVTAMSMPFCYLTFNVILRARLIPIIRLLPGDARLVTEQKQILTLIAKLGSASQDVAAALAKVPASELIPGIGSLLPRASSRSIGIG